MSEISAAQERLRKFNNDRRLASLRKRMDTMAERYGNTAHLGHYGQIRMIVTEWHKDENGIPTRTVTAI